MTSMNDESGMMNLGTRTRHPAPCHDARSWMASLWRLGRPRRHRWVPRPPRKPQRPRSTPVLRRRSQPPHRLRGRQRAWTPPRRRCTRPNTHRACRDCVASRTRHLRFHTPIRDGKSFGTQPIPASPTTWSWWARARAALPPRTSTRRSCRARGSWSWRRQTTFGGVAKRTEFVVKGKRYINCGGALAIQYDGHLLTGRQDRCWRTSASTPNGTGRRSRKRPRGRRSRRSNWTTRPSSIRRPGDPIDWFDPTSILTWPTVVVRLRRPPRRPNSRPSGRPS